MSERRLFVRGLPIGGGAVELDEAAVRHARVLRLREGSEVVLFDGRGGEASARLVRVGDRSAQAIAGPRRSVSVEGPELVLVQALAKGEKLDAIVRMATELGVSAIHLAASERSVVRTGEERAHKRVERLERIAREASRQSGRASVPAVAAPESIAAIGTQAPQDDLRIVLAPSATRSIAEACAGGARRAWIAVGPEGGFAPEEVLRLEAAGWIAVGLGRGVLRVETAVPVAIALVSSALGGLAPRAVSQS